MVIIHINRTSNMFIQLRFLNGGTNTHTIYSDGSDTSDHLRNYDSR